MDAWNAEIRLPETGAQRLAGKQRLLGAEVLLSDSTPSASIVQHVMDDPRDIDPEGLVHHGRALVHEHK
ncbi:hypothetical protein SAMN05216228_104718 [Rhizobium tibeticum]|uniref:Uncharacterized protein n=1 Tax=Rhizobium tibeticum TaxID=501024 RepID=A0A1H8VTW2_9HYPH|nr:hypothetical protein [Rhizobium tibeticum]SEI19603.1 hypothetical protein RTCCBAU85039_6200 [Rhizobium tibeticum]SEP18846.1 hypothetical protein SAMN05216228_104718 [Rhizobium tibeticum]